MRIDVHFVVQVIGALTLALGATNGHLTACAMMSAPRGLDHVKAELSGILSALFLVVGITIGAFSGYVWGVV
jgi:equilibrative nucleoside transporter 1/2/3